MNIIPVDNAKDLFELTDVLPVELIEKIKKENFWEYDWEFQDMQHDWKRRKLKSTALLQEIDVAYNKILDQIEHEIGITFINKHCYSSFWLDYDGFTCGIHEDGAERNYTPRIAMQIYLTESDDKLGTVWYHDPQGTQVRYQCPYRINSGYLMLNHAGQWHGMTNKVPVTHIRLSSYTYFGEFCHK